MRFSSLKFPPRPQSKTHQILRGDRLSTAAGPHHHTRQSGLHVLQTVRQGQDGHDLAGHRNVEPCLGYKRGGGGNRYYVKPKEFKQSMKNRRMECRNVWVAILRIMWKTKVSTFHVSKESKSHSRSTRSIFLFPTPLVIPPECVQGGAWRRQKDMGKGEKNGWTAKQKMQAHVQECILRLREGGTE